MIETTVMPFSFFSNGESLDDFIWIMDTLNQESDNQDAYS